MVSDKHRCRDSARIAGFLPVHFSSLVPIVLLDLVYL